MTLAERILAAALAMAPADAPAPIVAPVIVHEAQATGVDPWLALALALRESKLRPSAVNAKTGTSGVLQVSPRNCRKLRLDCSDLTQGIRAGLLVLTSMHAHCSRLGYPSWTSAVSAFNRGPKGCEVSRWARGVEALRARLVFRFGERAS